MSSSVGTSGDRWGAVSAPDADETREAHRRFLDRYYGASRHIYDLTRKYYLFGRDRLIAELAEETFSSLVELGPGTGRNLLAIRRDNTVARLGGVEASEAMLRTARRRCPFADLRTGFAEDYDLTSVLHCRPERVLFSYCLSMVQQPELALENALAHLADEGEVVLVDFGDFGEMPRRFGQSMNQWLRAFHVHPPSEAWLRSKGASISFGAGRYYMIARIPARRVGS